MTVFSKFSVLPSFCPHVASVIISLLDPVSRMRLSRISLLWRNCVVAFETLIFNPFNFFSPFFPNGCINEFLCMQNGLHFIVVGKAVLRFFQGLAPGRFLEILISSDRALPLLSFLSRMNYEPQYPPPVSFEHERKETQISSFVRGGDHGPRIQVELCDGPVIVQLLAEANLHKNFLTSDFAYSLYPWCSIIEEVDFPVSSNCALPPRFGNFAYPSPTLALQDEGELSVLKRRIGDTACWRIRLPSAYIGSLPEDFLPTNVNHNEDFELHCWCHLWSESGIQLCFEVQESEYAFSHTLVPAMTKGNMFEASLTEQQILDNARLWNRYHPQSPFMGRRLKLKEHLLRCLPASVDGRSMAFTHSFLLFFMRPSYNIKMSACIFNDDSVDLRFEVSSIEKYRYLKEMEKSASAVGCLVGEFPAVAGVTMLPFQTAYLMIIALMFVILAGNHALPIFLRFIIWIGSKIAPPNSDAHIAFDFLLHHPRRCFIYLFPSHQTWFLVICLVAFSAIEWIFFEILNIGLPAYESLSTGARIICGLFQGLAARASGFSIVPIASLAPALQFLYVVMMYIAVYPVAMSIRSTNVYEEQSLGVFEPPPEDEDEEPTDLAAYAPRQRVGRYLGWHLRRQMSIDIWWLVWAVFLIAIIERGNIMNEDLKWFDLFRVLFELVSAFGGIGLSLGLPSDNFSFAGALKPLSKLIIIVIMVRGRHRGLPVRVDKAVQLPIELVKRNQNQSQPQNQTDAAQAVP